MLPKTHLLYLIFHLSHLALVAHAQLSDALWPSWIPLAVRSPYLSGWMNTTNIPYTPTVKRAPEFWPQFWSGGTLGWAGHIRIDNNLTYKWLGDAGSPGGLVFSVLNNIQITPTRTVMSITSGPIDLNITYLSPIEPADPAKQSFPFTYISLTATSNDGQPHVVQVYSDISGEWASGNNQDVMNWQTVPTDTILYHAVSLATPLAFSEKGNEAVDSITYMASLLTQQMSWMADSDATCRGRFSSQGTLTNEANQGPKKISDAFNVFAISMDLGTVTATTDPVVWAVGMVRDPAVQAVTATGSQETRSPYWRSTGAAQDMLTAFLQDYPNAVERAESLDLALAANASAVSPHAADLVSLAARQAFAGTELTVGGSGTSFNTSDVKIFMKDLGVTGRVNPVEVMYAAFPAFLSVNATWGGWLLRPVLDFAVSPVWQQAYAPRDIGLNYPNATGDPAPHSQGIEQSGNMLIMTVAHARATGDGSLIGTYYPLLKQWADYLVNNTSPMPSNQATADVGSKANSTNLAIKGIIAIAAMSQVCAAMNETADAQRYLSTAQAYVNTWKSLALASDGHIISTYGDTANPSWALEYNLYADKWLGTNILDTATYNAETSFVQSLLGTNPNGLPISSDQAGPSANADTAWTLFTAMTMSDGGVRSSLIDYVWNIASRNMSGTIFSTLVALDGKGEAASNSAPSPGVGAMFAPVALSLPNTTIIVPLLANGTSRNPGGPSNPADPANSSSSSHSNVGPIVGGVVGGIGGLLLLLGLGFFLWRRRRAAADDRLDAASTQPRPFSYPQQTSHAWGSSVTHVSPTDAPGTPGAAYLRTTAKAAEARPAPPLATPGTGSAYTSSSGPASSREPPTLASRSDITSPISPQDVLGLRQEVRNLRLEMQNFRAEALEPPPTYHEEEH